MKNVCLVPVLAVCCVCLSASATVTIDPLGTAAPPSTVGGTAVTPFSADAQATGVLVSGVNSGVNGSISFSEPLTHYQAGGGWATWSHGYAGDVYFADVGMAADPSITITLPAATTAFYLYVEPEFFDPPFDITVNADGTVATAFGVSGNGGAVGFGIHTDGAALQSITVTIDNLGLPSGFAVGEFGINGPSGPGVVPEPSTFLAGALLALACGFKGLRGWRIRQQS